MRKEILKNIVYDNLKISDALKHMYSLKKHKQFIICLDKNKKVTGIFTEGDFRKAVYKEKNLMNPIKYIMNKNFNFISENSSNKKILKILSNPFTNFIPVIKNKYLVDVIFKEEFFKKIKFKKRKLPTPIVIVSGGKGTRMEPFTKILPKPLLPINDKSLLENLIEKFNSYGFFNIYLTLGYKADIIKSFLKTHKIRIKTVKEKKPLGSIGSLSLLSKKLNENFFVSNCDTLINANYNDILKFHEINKCILTIVGSVKNFQVPYGVCKINKQGFMIKFEEKPDHSNIINTGLYVFSKRALKLLPRKKFFNIDELINKMLESKLKIGVYPVPSKNWLDFGQWAEYHVSKNEMKELNNV